MFGGGHGGLVDVEDIMALPYPVGCIELFLFGRKLVIVRLADDVFRTDMLVVPLHPVEAKGVLVLLDRRAAFLGVVKGGVEVGTVAFLVGLQVHHDVVVGHDGTLRTDKLGVALARLVHPNALVALGEFQRSKKEGGMQEKFAGVATVFLLLSVLFFLASLLFDFPAPFVFRLFQGSLLGLLCLLLLFLNGGLLVFDDGGRLSLCHGLGYIAFFHDVLGNARDIGFGIAVLGKGDVPCRVLNVLVFRLGCNSLPLGFQSRLFTPRIHGMWYDGSHRFLGEQEIVAICG